MNDGRCTCGQPGEWMADPFVFEIYDETVMAYWCNDCAYERALDV